jgi:hypothetical protein
LADWEARWQTDKIEDEDGSSISASEMRQIVTSRVQFQGRPLLRHEVDGRHCLAHGDGTYDICRGEFF